MPGMQWYPFWEGNRSELLATHVLSSVCSVVPVPHQFEFGFDLLCTLTHQVKNALFAGRSFGSQVKAASVPSVLYGGIDDKGHWKAYELEWLYGQDQPHFLVRVDLQGWKVQVYSTTRMWWLKWQVGMPGEVQLLPGVDLEEFDGHTIQNRYASTDLPPTSDGTPAGNGRSYRVPLGSPIAEVILGGAGGERFRDSLRHCLEAWIDVEYENIRHFRTSIPFVIEPHDWQPSARLPLTSNIWHFSNGTYDQNVREILGAIGPGITSLMQNLKAQGQGEKVEMVRAIAQLAWRYGALDPIGIEFLNRGAASGHGTDEAPA